MQPAALCVRSLQPRARSLQPRVRSLQSHVSQGGHLRGQGRPPRMHGQREQPLVRLGHLAAPDVRRAAPLATCHFHGLLLTTCHLLPGMLRCSGRRGTSVDCTRRSATRAARKRICRRRRTCHRWPEHERLHVHADSRAHGQRSGRAAGRGAACLAPALRLLRVPVAGRPVPRGLMLNDDPGRASRKETPWRALPEPVGDRGAEYVT